MGIVACSARHDVPVLGVSGVGLLAPHDSDDLTTSPAPNRGLFTLVDDGPSQPLPLPANKKGAPLVVCSCHWLTAVNARGVAVLRLGSCRGSASAMLPEEALA